MSKIAIVIAGILAAIIVLVFVASAVANSLFEKQVSKEVEKLFGSGQVDKKEIITEADLAGLPVRAKMAGAIPGGGQEKSTVRLKQSGVMRLRRLSPGCLLRLTILQCGRAGFCMESKVKMNPLLYFSGGQVLSGQGKWTLRRFLLTVANAGANVKWTRVQCQISC